MDPRHRDGVLAAGGLVALLAGAAAAGALAAVVDPLAAAAGVAGTALLEVAFLRYPDWLLAAWDRRGAPTAALVVVLALGAVAVGSIPAVLGVLVWGLATYLALLGCVLAGLGNPLAPIASLGDRE